MDAGRGSSTMTTIKTPVGTEQPDLTDVDPKATRPRVPNGGEEPPEKSAPGIKYLQYVGNSQVPGEKSDDDDAASSSTAKKGEIALGVKDGAVSSKRPHAGEHAKPAQIVPLEVPVIDDDSGVTPETKPGRSHSSGCVCCIVS